MDNTSTPTLSTVELLEALRNNPEARAAIATLYSKSQNAQRDAEIAQRIWAGERYGVVAADYGISVNRISQIMASRPNPNPQPRVSHNAERDAKIVAKARAKVPRAEIAREFNLSVIRVNQIVGAAPKVKKMTIAEKKAEAMRKYNEFEDLTLEDDCWVMIAKYEPWARQIATLMAEGHTPEMLTCDFKPDTTGGDIHWTAEHFEMVGNMLYNFEYGLWKM